MSQGRFDPRFSLILLRVRIEGKANRELYLRMALDTGASLSVIPWNVAETLGYDPARSPRRVRFMTGSGVEAAPMFSVEALEVLGIRVKGVAVLCHDLPQRSLVDGLLGLSFLRHCRLSIDFQCGILQLAKSVS